MKRYINSQNYFRNTKVEFNKMFDCEESSTLYEELLNTFSAEAERHLQSMTPIIANVLLPSVNSVVSRGVAV